MLRSLAVAGAGTFAGCQCAPGPMERRLTLFTTDDPQRSGGRWELDVEVEHELGRVGDTPFETARLVPYDAERSSLDEQSIGPFSESNGYEVTSSEACGGGRNYTYTKTVTLQTAREPKYVNPYVPTSACSDVEEPIEPLVLDSEWEPAFLCGQRFPFQVLDVEQAPAHDGGDWPTRSFDAARTGYNPDGTGPRDLSEVAWSVPVGDIATRPVVEYGAVYVVPDDTRDGDDEQRLQVGAINALDLETGELAFTASGSERGVTVAGGLVYGGHFDVVASDAGTGQIKWAYDIETDAEAVPAPTVAHQRVYVVDREGTARAVAADDGRRLWTSDVGKPASLVPGTSDSRGYRVSPLAADDTTLYVMAGGAVRALDPGSGEPRWTRSVAGLAGVPRVGADTVYVPREGQLVALSTADGSERWNESVEGMPTEAVVAEGTVYVGEGHEVRALAAATGAEQWATDVDDAVTVSARVGDRLYASTYEALHVLDAATGDKVGRKVDEAGFRSPVVAGQRVLYVTDDGVLRVLE